MKIAFAMESYLPRMGGTEIRVHELVNKLPDSWDIDIFTPRFDGLPVDEWEQKNVHIHRLGNFNSSSYFLSNSRPIMPSIKYGMELRKELSRTKDADAVIFSEWNLMHFRLAHGQSRSIEIADWCEVLSNNKAAGLPIHKRAGEAYLERYLSKKADVHLAVNKKIGNLLNSVHGVKNDNVQVVPNGISDEMITDHFPEKKRGSILYVGRISKHKQVDMLISAARRLKNFDIELNIAGLGSDSTYNRELKELAGSDKRINFLGGVSNNELRQLYKSSWILALPSSREGSGIVSLEAMGSYTPTLTVDAPLNLAQHDMVRNGENGLVVKNNVDGLVEGISRFYNMSDSEYANLAVNAYGTAKQRTWSESSRKLEKLLGKL